MRNQAVVSVIGRDQKGVVARISTYLASCNINIEDIEQRVMEGLFIMTMRVDLTDVSLTLDELVLGLRTIGDEIGMEVKVRLAGGRPERKRVAVLVTREPHCLEQLLRDRSRKFHDREFLGRHFDAEFAQGSFKQQPQICNGCPRRLASEQAKARRILALQERLHGNVR